MSGMLFFTVLFAGILFIVCGAICAFLPMVTIVWARKSYRRLRRISEDKVETPIKRRTVVLERVQGCVFIILGILLITCSSVLPSLSTTGDLSLRNPAGTHATDFKSAVKAIVAAEGLLSDAPEPKPPTELRILSAKYGARNKWIDVTMQVRQKINNSTLAIRAGNDIAGDPLFGVAKTLRLEYVLDGERKTAALREGAELRIPGDPFDGLKTITTARRLVSLARACPAEVGFYGKNFTTGQMVEYRPDQSACLASIVKVFPLLEVMRQVEKGRVQLSAPITIARQQGKETCTISEALDKMIGISDNEATAALARLVGYDEINALPKKLGITGLSDQILPRPGVLDGVLDQRVYGLRVPQKSHLLPQHGTARGVVRYFELLHKNELVNKKISQRVLEVFDRNPMYFAPNATPANFRSGGKGGSILWVRPFHQPYNMVGWGILIRNEKVALGFCLWCEWFPARMSQEEQLEWCSGLSDCIVNILLLPAPGDGQRKTVAPVSVK
jgi:hypothetical protein